MKLKTKKTLTPIKAIQDTFLKLTEAAVKTIEGGAEMPPRLFAILEPDKKGDMEVMGLPLEVAKSGEERGELCRIAARVLATEHFPPVLMFVTISEAWASTFSADPEAPKTMRDQLIKTGGMRPSEDPQREEVLFVSAEDVGGNMATITFSLIPGKKAREVVFKKLGEEKEGEIIWHTLEERRKKKGEITMENRLLSSAWMEYKLVKSGF
jgi:hypothetical protein